MPNIIIDFFSLFHWSDALYLFAMIVSCGRFIFNEKKYILAVAGSFFIMNGIYFGINGAVAGSVLCFVSALFAWTMIFVSNISIKVQIFIALTCYFGSLAFYGFDLVSLLPAFGFMLGRFAEMASSVLKYWILDIITVLFFLAYMVILGLWFAAILTAIQVSLTAIHLLINVKKSDILQREKDMEITTLPPTTIC